jgi:glycosyltransferase involved in cell wall biosynthesis
MQPEHHRDFIVNAIPAHLGGILTYTRELARTLPTVCSPSRSILVAPSAAVPADAASSLDHVKVDGRTLRDRIDAETGTLYSIVSRSANPVLFATANFTLLERAIPQLLLVRNSFYFDPACVEHVGPRLSVRERAKMALRRGLTLAAAARVQMVMTPSQTMRDLLLADSPELTDKVVVNPYGVRLEQFAGATKARVPSPRGTLRVVCHSLIGLHKPVWPIIAAVAEVRRRKVRATLLLTDDPFNPSHQGRTDEDMRWARRGLDEQWLTCVPPVKHEQLPALLAKHDTFAWHTITESFGHPYYEAMAAGLPSVVTDIPIARERCGDGARYVPIFSPKAIADCLEEDASDPEERVARGERARAYAAAHSNSWWNHFSRCAELMRAMA